MHELNSVTLIVTNQCNLNCKHCYVNAGRRLDNELTINEIENLLKQLYLMGVMKLDISGGEPLLRPDIVDILQMANSMGFSIVLLTNGTLLDREKVSMLSQIDLTFIQIPIEGLCENHENIRGKGTFELCLESIKLLKESNLPVQARMTVNKKSLREIEEVAKIMAELKVDSFLLAEFVPVGRGSAWEKELRLNREEQLRFKEVFVKVKIEYPGLSIRGGPYGFLEGEKDFEYADDFKKSFTCGLLRGDWCQIVPDGTVTPCDLIMFQAGNIRYQQFQDIWNNSPVFKAFRNFNLSNLKGACGKCEHKLICGGCRALALLFNGDIYAEDPMCIRAQEVLTCK